MIRSRFHVGDSDGDVLLHRSHGGHADEQRRSTVGSRRGTRTVVFDHVDEGRPLVEVAAGVPLEEEVFERRPEVAVVGRVGHPFAGG